VSDHNNEGAGVISRVLTQFPARPAVSDEAMLENVRSALKRNLPRVQFSRAHDRVMSIAAGGPSLEDTWKDLSGVIVSVNASLGFLLERDITPWACGLLDARPHIADLIEPHPDVFFFVASICHPRVFQKLHGCNVGLWHPTGMPGLETELPAGTDMIGGGSTMGLRWLNLGYVMGFRKFEAHGLDSSFRGEKTHAYPDRRDGQELTLMIDGYPTSINFLQQVEHFLEVRRMFAGLDEPPVINLHGSGLLQAVAARRNLPEVRADEVLKRLSGIEAPVGAELGVFAGAMSEALLRGHSGLHLDMVDSWRGDGQSYLGDGDWHATLSQKQQGDFYAMAVRRTDFARDRRTIHIAETDAVQSRGDYDFVFIDADHSYEGCSRDIRLWAPRIKSGGWLCGHDYGHPNPQFGVTRSVDEYVAHTGLTLEFGEDYTWFVRVP
jgi:hypothetical protein